MANVRVLLAGESWVSAGIHVKGFDRFAAAECQIGIATLRDALAGGDVTLTHLAGHLVPTEFPSDRRTLDAYDVVVLSDIGSNSLHMALPPTCRAGGKVAGRRWATARM
jgi:uncharacterized membrane protein